MGFLVGIFKTILKLTIYLAILLAIILLIPNLPPYTKFTSIEIEPTQPRVGALAPNGILNNVERLYEGKLLGPEAFQIYNGEVYTGLATGEIVKISPGGHVTFVTKIGKPCTGLVQEHICGRPLGFVIDEKNKLMYVADAYYGIWKINLVTDKKQLLVSPQVPIEGKVPKIFNSLALDKNGDIFWTHSSTDYHLKDGVMVLFTDPTGRLLHYNSAKNESKVLLDELWLANGLLISPDNQFIVVAESNRYRLLKYYLNGPKKGTSEVFSAGLPGTPDTLRSLPDGSGILVSLYSVFDDEHPMLTKTMAAAPQARKLIARLIRLVEIQFEFLNNQFPNYIFEQIVYYIGSFASVAGWSPGMSGLIQLDWNGNIVASYYNTDGSLLHISDAIVYNGKLFTACPHLQNFVGAVPAPQQLLKAFSNTKPAVKELKKETKPVDQIKTKVDEQKEAPKVPEKVQQKEVPRVPEKVQQKQQPNKVAEKQAEQKFKESHVKQNTVSKETGTKPKVVAKDTETKPKVEAGVKPKVVAKDEAKQKHSKESEIKSKAENKETEKKPPVVSKTPDIQQKVSDIKPKNPPEVKPKVAPKEQETKPTVTKTKPDNKQKDTKTKPSEESNVKPKTVSQEPSQVKSSPKPEEVKKESQNNKEEKNAKKVEAESKSENTENASKASSKPIPVEEKISSDTAKPSKGTLKVIKKSGPQEIPNPNL